VKWKLRLRNPCHPGFRAESLKRNDSGFYYSIVQKKKGFVKNPNWETSEKELRELRKGVYYAILAEEDNIDKVASIVEYLFNHLFIAYDL